MLVEGELDALVSLLLTGSWCAGTDTESMAVNFKMTYSGSSVRAGALQAILTPSYLSKGADCLLICLAPYIFRLHLLRMYDCIVQLLYIHAADSCKHPRACLE